MTKRKSPKNFKPNGRPTKYKPEFDDLAYKFALLGATNKEMAGFFDVAESTFDLWRIAHPKFSGAITRGKAVADANVADRLYQRAMGYEHDEEKIFQYEGKPVRVATTKHYPPDTQAASLWLRNRQPELWRDQKDITLRQPDKEPRTTKELVDRCKELDEELAILLPQLNSDT